jgi:hypothetical protein
MGEQDCKLAKRAYEDNACLIASYTHVILTNVLFSLMLVNKHYLLKLVGCLTKL